MNYRWIYNCYNNKLAVLVATYIGYICTPTGLKFSEDKCCRSTDVVGVDAVLGEALGDEICAVDCLVEGCTR